METAEGKRNNGDENGSPTYPKQTLLQAFREGAPRERLAMAADVATLLGLSFVVAIIKPLASMAHGAGASWAAIVAGGAAYLGVLVGCIGTSWALVLGVRWVIEYPGNGRPMPKMRLFLTTMWVIGNVLVAFVFAPIAYDELYSALLR